MELIYYSYYPYKDPNKVLVKDEDENDLWGQPFRLYKAATCKSLIDFQSEKDFVHACFEAMDCPEYRIQDYEKGQPYKDEYYGVEVTPTKYFYGATNSEDGVFYFPASWNSYIVPLLVDEPIVKDNWLYAALEIFRKHHSFYATRLVDFTREK